jgi:hypothetical protein
MGAALPIGLTSQASDSHADQRVRDALTRNLGPDIAARVG